MSTITSMPADLFVFASGRIAVPGGRATYRVITASALADPDKIIHCNPGDDLKDPA